MPEDNSNELWDILWDKAGVPTSTEERIKAANQLIKQQVLNPPTTLPNLLSNHTFLMTLDGFDGLEAQLRSLIEQVPYGCRTI